MHKRPFNILGIDHVVLRARDAANLVNFYVEALGCALRWERPELGLFHLAAGRAMLDIVSIDGPLGQAGVAAAAAAAAAAAQGRNVDHVCFQVDAIKIDDLRTLFAKYGLEIDQPKSRFGAQGFGPSVYLQDPEGNGIELKLASPPEILRGQMAASPR